MNELVLIKRKLRKELRQRHAELDHDYIAQSDTGIYENISKLPEFLSAKTIFTYYSIENEADTHELIRLALSMGKTVTVPVCHGEGIMDAVIIKSLADLKPGAYNIPEPSKDAEIISPDKIEFAVIPALSFDKKGYRIGQGGGYYDRFLLNRKFFAAGIIRSIFFEEELPKEDHDVPITCVVTENEIARLY